MKGVGGRSMTGAHGKRVLMGLVLGLSFISASCGGGSSDSGGGGNPPSNNPPALGAANQFAYAINSASNTVQAFTMDGNGNLTPAGGQGLQPTGRFPHHVDVDRQGRFVYISNHEENFVTGYKINNDGSLAAINPAPASPVTNLQNNDPTDNNPHSSVIDQTGQFLYVVAGVPPAMSTVKTYTINGSTGTLTQIGTTGPLAQCAHGHNITLTANNNFVYVACEDSGMVYSFSRNTSTGQLTLVPGTPTAVVGVAFAVAVDPGNRFLFVGNNNSVDVFSIGGNGALTAIQGGPNNGNSFPTGNAAHSLTVDPTGQFVYTANLSSSDISGFRLDPNTGVLTALAGSPYPTGGGPNYITVHPDGKVLFTADAGGGAGAPPGNKVSRFTVNADGTLTRTADAFDFPANSGTNGIGTTKF